VVKVALCGRTHGQLHGWLGLGGVASEVGDRPRRVGAVSSNTTRAVPSNRFTIARCAKVYIDGQAKPPLELEKIFQEAFTFGREDGLRVKLDSVDGERFVLQAHDFAFGCFGGDFKDVGQGVAFDDERVVAGGFERRWEIFEDAFSGVENRRGFSVHEAVGADDFAAVDLADALVPEADAEDGEARAEGLDDVAADAGFGGSAGTG
jgi:hypothetical protein